MTLADDSVNHSTAHHVPSDDVEKRGELNDKDADIHVSSFNGSNSDENTTRASDASSLGPHDIPPTPVLLTGRLKRWNDKIEGLAGLEARGITRVLPEEKHDISPIRYVHMWLLWFSVNITVNNLAVGFLGPLVFSLGWVDSVLLTVFGCALGSVGTAYTSTFGAASGNRTLVCFALNSANPPMEVLAPELKSALDCGSIHNGLLAGQADCPFKRHSHDWIRHHQLYHCRTNAIRR